VNQERQEIASERGRTQRAMRWRRIVARWATVLLVVLAAIAAGVWIWWRFRPLPEPVSRPLFRGITYRREIRRAPRLAVVHLVTVKVGTPGLGFFVTPGDPSKPEPLAARTTSDFLREFHVQLAVNGDFFAPWHSNGPHDYYPHRGDPVHPQGFAAAEGVAYRGERGGGIRTLRFGRDERPSFTLPLDQAVAAISGEDLIAEGEPRVSTRNPGGPEPRTAVGLDREEATLFVLVADGRQPHYSLGLDIAEVAAELRRAGAWNAVNLDGGGSTALVIEGASGAPEVLSTPIHTRIPGRERPVANHLGIRAERL
jgi:hypothetical protein